VARGHVTILKSHETVFAILSIYNYHAARGGGGVVVVVVAMVVNVAPCRCKGGLVAIFRKIRTVHAR
jgi:hypothetical protein